MTKIYYYSDNKVDFKPVSFLDDEELMENTYPFVITAPDPTIKSPKYDWAESTWIDVSMEQQGVVIADLQSQIGTLTKNNEDLTTHVTQLQQALTDMAMSTLVPETEVATDDTNA